MYMYMYLTRTQYMYIQFCTHSYRLNTVARACVLDSGHAVDFGVTPQAPHFLLRKCLAVTMYKQFMMGPDKPVIPGQLLFQAY